MGQYIFSRIALASIALIGSSAVTAASNTGTALRQASYANINYDVTYVRCPRGLEPVTHPTTGEKLLNWNGVNDIWIDASNNIYQQPGCDLMLHHSDAGYGGSLPLGDPGREEVLVNCNEGDKANPICTIVDPNVSFDGKRIIYSKFTDTRTTVGDYTINNGGGNLGNGHNQSFMHLYPDRNIRGDFAEQFGTGLKPYAAPALIFMYDLESKTETRISPDAKLAAGRAHPGRTADWTVNVPVMDTGPFFLPDGRIGFTSNRDSGFLRFQLFTMDIDGKNLELIGHRALGQQLHPSTLADGRIMYTSDDRMLQKVGNNQYSLFTTNPDGSFPFILAGKLDATEFSYHYATQLSDGDIVVTLYYNHNNTGLGSLLRFPIDPPGPNFTHLSGPPDNTRPYDTSRWANGTNAIPFARKGQFLLTPQAIWGDAQAWPYASAADYWIHPNDNRTVSMRGKFTHPSAAPDNGLLVTYSIGGSSTQAHPDFRTTWEATNRMIGKDAGIWLVPLEPNSSRLVGHIADDARIIVDQPQYHEIMARAVVPYNRIHNVAGPTVRPKAGNTGTKDARLPAGKPYGLSGAASLMDRETRALNGVPWNMEDGGGVMAGRTYTNLAASGADLAIFANTEVYGIRVTLPMPTYINNYSGGMERWAGIQEHHLRILGEFPVRKPDGTPLDGQGNPDTSFVVRVPANTPFLFQTLDKRGMALDVETSSRTVAAGELQFCGGCHVHTRDAQDPAASLAKLDTSATYGDFIGDSAPLFSGLDAAGNPVVKTAKEIYPTLPGIKNRRSFGVDWNSGISTIIGNRCASCHGEGQSAQQITGLRLDKTDLTYDLLINNKYKREDGVNINSSTKPGNGLTDLDNAGNDRITPRYACCTPSRWISLNSARSSMLVWALYGERLDGRDPATGLPYKGSDVLVDPYQRDRPEVWPKVGEHAAYVANMPESEKQLVARWLELGAPKANIHDDMIRPVLTVTPQTAGSSISTVLIGMWDDSPLDYSKFKVSFDGVNITPNITGAPDVITITFPTTITLANAQSHQLSVEIWDKPDRSLSWVSPGVAAANRSILTLDGMALLRRTDTATNHAPKSALATIVTTASTASMGVLPKVDDPDASDSHYFVIATNPAHGKAQVLNNRLVYVPDAGYTGADRFSFKAMDLGGLEVVGNAEVTVKAGTPVALTPPPPANQTSDLGAGSSATVVPSPPANAPPTPVDPPISTDPGPTLEAKVTGPSGGGGGSSDGALLLLCAAPIVSRLLREFRNARRGQKAFPTLRN